ncbi:chromosome partition protein Smc-like [Pituophis catenifer annectens]|uniref:chromosome partition protein Smc-like n=1 Tax=Pituophis catenifer annectens TaxID=94852 RepID=UPI003995615C
MAYNHEETRKNHEELRMDVGEIKDNIRNMDEKIGKIQHKIEENEQRIYKVEERIEHTNKRMEKMEYNQAATNKDLEDTVSYLEMEKASFYLRFQNVEEQKEEDLGEIMTEILSEVTQRDKEEIRSGIDEIYRIVQTKTERLEVDLKRARDQSYIKTMEMSKLLAEKEELELKIQELINKTLQLAKEKEELCEEYEEKLSRKNSSDESGQLDKLRRENESLSCKVQKYAGEISLEKPDILLTLERN